MTKKRGFLIFMMLILSAFTGANVTPSEHIRKIIEDLQANTRVTIEGQQLYCTKLLPEFYIKRQFEPAWQNSQKIAEFLKALSGVHEAGLAPGDYHFYMLSILVENPRTSEEKAELDILLTDAFILYASHLLNGKVNPETLDSEWKAIRRENNSIDLLEQAISRRNIRKFLEDQEPQEGSYQYLKKALSQFKIISEDGGWPVIPDGASLKPGMQDSIRVPLLIRRLTVSGELPVHYENTANQFTSALSEAVKKYQAKNGLEEDGYLGKMTTTSLNVPVEQRIHQITINLERHRWIAHDLGDKYVFVNIAGFQLMVVENGVVVFREKVIVGKPFRKTPVFSSRLTYFVLNPYWTVPPVILYNDILPEMKKNPEYVASKNIKVLQGYGSEAREVDPSTLDWSGFSKGNFPYTLRQEPGMLNALGQVKFMFPNSYNVYIHDTPGKELFNRPERTFSSGCIRLNKPLSFVEYLVKDQSDLSMEQIRNMLAIGQEHTIMLKRPLNVHIQYLTCWAENDMIQFRSDVYDRDKALLAALKERPSIL